MLRVLGNILYDLDPKVKVKSQILNFLVNASPPKAFDVVTSNSVGQMMYFLVNASSPKLLDVAPSNFAGAKVI